MFEMRMCAWEVYGTKCALQVNTTAASQDSAVPVPCTSATWQFIWMDAAAMSPILNSTG